jgi:hypothetical protein
MLTVTDAAHRLGEFESRANPLDVPSAHLSGYCGSGVSRDGLCQHTVNIGRAFPRAYRIIRTTE